MQNLLKTKLSSLGRSAPHRFCNKSQIEHTSGGFQMEEYFARQRRRRLLGAACSLVVFAAVFVVALFAMFRTHSNYQFRSIADFLRPRSWIMNSSTRMFRKRRSALTRSGPCPFRSGKIRGLCKPLPSRPFSESITVFRSFRQTNIMAQKHEVLWRYTRHGIH